MAVLGNQCSSFVLFTFFFHFKRLNDSYKQHIMSNVETTKTNNICLQRAYSLMFNYLKRHEYSLVITKFQQFFSQSLLMLDSENKRHQHWTLLHFYCHHLNYSTHYWLPHTWDNFLTSSSSSNPLHVLLAAPFVTAPFTYFPWSKCFNKYLKRTFVFSSQFISPNRCTWLQIT